MGCCVNLFTLHFHRDQHEDLFSPSFQSLLTSISLPQLTHFHETTIQLLLEICYSYLTHSLLNNQYSTRTIVKQIYWNEYAGCCCDICSCSSFGGYGFVSTTSSVHPAANCRACRTLVNTPVLATKVLFSINNEQTNQSTSWSSTNKNKIVRHNVIHICEKHPHLQIKTRRIEHT